MTVNLLITSACYVCFDTFGELGPSSAYGVFMLAQI